MLHLASEYKSRLAGVLQKWTSMPVIRVSEPIKVEANCVYVIPPHKHLLMADGHLIPRQSRRLDGLDGSCLIFRDQPCRISRQRIRFRGLDRTVQNAMTEFPRLHLAPDGRVFMSGTS